MTTPPQTPEELSVWLSVFKDVVRVRDDNLLDYAESEANAALIEHRDRVGTQTSTTPGVADSTIGWLTSVMRYAPPPEHSAAYGAFMSMVRELMDRSDVLRVDTQALAEAQSE